MSLRETLAALPPGALLPASWVLSQLDAGGQPAVDAPDLDVTAFGQLVRRSPATARAWCERGLVPGAYRLPGDRRRAAWRIPADSVIAFRQLGAPNTPPVIAEPPAARAADLGAWRRSRPRSGRRPTR